MKLTVFILNFLALCMVASAQAGQTHTSNAMDELDPRDPQINKVLEKMDKDYQKATGQSPFLQEDPKLNLASTSDCYQSTCHVFALVNKSKQTLELYVDGVLQATWPTSSGRPGHTTPDFDKHPDGRIYNAYTSTKFPGGDFDGLGNMPYAVFIEGGFAIHGTGRSNWSKLGHVASHGCIRIHPDNAVVFNHLVRQYGIRQTWITVRD